jgi:hypothetical protein
MPLSGPLNSIRGSPYSIAYRDLNDLRPWSRDIFRIHPYWRRPQHFLRLRSELPRICDRLSITGVGYY